MSETTPPVSAQEIVDRLRQKMDGVIASAQASSEPVKSCRYLLAIALNAFARAGAGKPLTDLEQKLVQMYRDRGYGDADLAAIGETFTAASATARTAMFPARFAQLDTETGYAMADLRADMPLLAQEILKSPNVRVRASDPGLALSAQDLATLQARLAEQGQSMDIEQLGQLLRPAERVNEGERDPGWGVVCYAVPMVSGAAAPAEARSVGSIRVKARTVECYKGTHEVGNDEPFFGFAVTDDTDSLTYQSPEFSMDEGDSRDFPDNTLWNGWVHGGGLAVVIDAWEADRSDVYERHGEMLRQLVWWFMDQMAPDDWMGLVETVIGDISGWGVPAWIYALAAGATSLVIQFLGNPDDHLWTTPVMIPTAHLYEWDEQRRIVASNSPEEAVRQLSSRSPWRDNPLLQMMLPFLLATGTDFSVWNVYAKMDRDSENHGIYEVGMQVYL
jgi:hypothetical protein